MKTENYYYVKLTDGSGRVLVNSRFIVDTLEEAIEMYPELEKYIKYKKLKGGIENGKI